MASEKHLTLSIIVTFYETTKISNSLRGQGNAVLTHKTIKGAILSPTSALLFESST